MQHYNIRENCVHKAIHEFKDVTVDHVAGITNPADIFTKEFKSDEVNRSIRDLI